MSTKKPRATKATKLEADKALIIKPIVKPLPKIPITWTIHPNYMIGYTTNDLPDFTNAKIAAFDLDDTLIKCKSASKFANNEDDWMMFDDDIINKLKTYVETNYKLVIVTNQKGISNKKTDPEMWKNKVSNIINHLELDFTILCCTTDDCHRKPGTKLWDTYIKNYDKDNSFYCGDAGSLPARTVKNIKFKKDFADTDLKFALNLGLKFVHRDEFVYGVTNTFQYNINYPNVKSYCKKSSYVFNPSGKQEMVLLCGFPASGKSNFTQTIGNDFVVINQDTLKTAVKCTQLTEKSLKDGKSVVIDNTCISKEKRLVYIDIAKKYNVEVRCLLFTCPIELCKHNSHYRNFITDGKIDVIPSIAYNVMKAKYEKPDIDEGFVSVDEIDFCFDAEVNTEHYCKYYF